MDISNKSYSIRIRNANNSEQIWDFDFENDIIIGRYENCHIRLSDKSVSRQHCRIYFNEGFIIENLSNTNKTKLNGSPVETQFMLSDNDSIICGRETLIVDSITCVDSKADENTHSGTVYIYV